MMQRLLAVRKILLGRAATGAGERGGALTFHGAFPQLTSQPLGTVPLSSLFKESFCRRWYSGISNFPSGFCSGFTSSGLVIPFAFRAQPVKFFRRKGFGACQPDRRYWSYSPESDEAVFWLIGVNVAVYFLWRFVDSSFMQKHFVVSLENLRNGNFHTMLTSAFSHSELDHLVTNMIGLYFFGKSISSLFGPTYLLKLYTAGALGGSIFFLLHRAYLETFQSYRHRAHALGASAAVNAIILLDVLLFPKNIYYVNLVIPVPAILMGAFIIGSDLWRIKKGDEYVSGSSHMGGAAVALVAWIALKRGWF
ncbi:hypothetical protein HPP92_018596 [Vanilla planifolia]|uniref:Peptidase S54 rhomboid domain-containing protein n=1 Tax=Vanilla planifolia TaxID=51239 RepID=A0A835UPN9_VANPL|nr:hypothetical protein HPP92_018596 [Vanilla planifolia]